MATFKGSAMEGNRAQSLSKQREQQKEEFERQKQLIAKEAELKVASITNKFAAKADAVEELLKSETVGLVTLDDFTAKREKLQLEREKQLAAARKLAEEKNKAKELDTAKKKPQKAALSFSMDDEEEVSGGTGNSHEDAASAASGSALSLSLSSSSSSSLALAEDSGSAPPAGSDGESRAHTSMAVKRESEDSAPLHPGKKVKLMKNPEVDTSFLPDRKREELERQERERLRQEWVAQQEKIKNEEIEIVYSYWDGSGHRRSTKVKKGYTIGKFLEVVLDSLRKEFPELRAVSSDSLMYIKEDLILPQHSSFYDFIVTQARGKSGPLFDFDVHDDIRITHDASVEKSESHAGKILLRSWYERHKHIFPANRWEPYDPEKKWEKYTIK